MIASKIRIFDDCPMGMFRTAEDEHGSLWFCVQDIQDILGCGAFTIGGINPDVDVRNVAICHTLTPKGWQKMEHVNVCGLGALLLKANTEKSRSFGEWLITHVLNAVSDDCVNLVEVGTMEHPFTIADHLLRLCREKDQLCNHLRGVVYKTDLLVQELRTNKQEEEKIWHDR